MLFKLSAVAAGGFAITSVALWLMLGNVKGQLALTNAELGACGARVTNIIEDLESDNAIDNLPDSALRAVPPEWLRPEGD